MQPCLCACRLPVGVRAVYAHAKVAQPGGRPLGPVILERDFLCVVVCRHTLSCTAPQSCLLRSVHSRDACLQAALTPVSLTNRKVCYAVCYRVCYLLYTHSLCRPRLSEMSRIPGVGLCAVHDAALPVCLPPARRRASLVCTCKCGAARRSASPSASRSCFSERPFLCGCVLPRPVMHFTAVVFPAHGFSVLASGV